MLFQCRFEITVRNIGSFFTFQAEVALPILPHRGLCFGPDENLIASRVNYLGLDGNDRSIIAVQLYQREIAGNPATKLHEWTGWHWTKKEAAVDPG